TAQKLTTDMPDIASSQTNRVALDCLAVFVHARIPISNPLILSAKYRDWVSAKYGRFSVRHFRHQHRFQDDPSKVATIGRAFGKNSAHNQSAREWSHCGMQDRRAHQ